MTIAETIGVGGGVLARIALVTGFEGYGGRDRNPAGETAKALDRQTVAGCAVVGRQLPVSYKKLSRCLIDLMQEHQPEIVISLGLWPGESIIRLERIGINCADFEIPDNEGVIVSDAPITNSGAAALMATLPNRQIRSALLNADIPARISSTAGTFLCNATLYATLSFAQTMRKAPLTGFIHVPYLPEQIVALLTLIESDRRLELHQRSDTASMDLAMMIRAVEIAIATTAIGLS
jgi:pyroglutamyl-peptidase